MVSEGKNDLFAVWPRTSMVRDLYGLYPYVQLCGHNFKINQHFVGILCGIECSTCGIDYHLVS